VGGGGVAAAYFVFFASFFSLPLSFWLLSLFGYLIQGIGLTLWGR